MKKYLMMLGVAGAFVQPAFANDGEDWAKNGIRAEVRTSWETPTVSSVNTNNDIYKLGSAFSIGGEVGFDIKVGDKIAVGPYATYEKSNVENCEGTDCVRARDALSVGLQLGYATSEQGQVYVKAGYSQLRLQADLDLGAGPVRVNDKGEGFGGAIGYEHSFGKNFYGRLEGGYADVGQIYGLNFQRRHVAIGLGVRF